MIDVNVLLSLMAFECTGCGVWNLHVFLFLSTFFYQIY